MQWEMRLYRDTVKAKAAARRPGGGLGVVYVREGALALGCSPGSGTLGPNSAWLLHPDSRLAGGSSDAELLRWEVAPTDAPDNALAGEGIVSERLLAARMPLDSSAPWLLRCDRVDFPADGEALTHVHAGGGIRCLLFGRIAIHSEGEVHAYDPVQGWYEAGPEPVYAKVAADAPAAFARVMLLPREYLGRSSIRYVRPEDLDKPKHQRYQVFVDAPIDLPG